MSEISDTEVRVRCIEAAARAMAGAKLPQESSQAFAGNVLGLVNGFYALASGAKSEAGANLLGDLLKKPDQARDQT